MKQAMENILTMAEGNTGSLTAIARVAKQAIEADDKERNAYRWTRINNEYCGNPRYVVHFLQCMPKTWVDEKEKYAMTCKLMNKIGGRKYNNKSYGDGIVFSSYSLPGLEQQITDLKNSIK